MCKLLEGEGHEVIRLRDVIPTDTPDPIVAKVAEQSDSILLTHDGDFKKVAPRIPEGERSRFRRLSKIHLSCDPTKSAKRLEAAMNLVVFEWEASQARNDKRMHIVVQPTLMKTLR